MDSNRPQLNRRVACCRLLMASLGLVAGGNAFAQRSEPPADNTTAADEIESLRKASGLSSFGTSQSEHFLAVGDAPDDFRGSALKHCEALAIEFLRHFKEKGFPLRFPARRLPIIVLRDVKSYQAMLGEAPGKDVGGHFDLGTNRLVMFDFRPGSEMAAKDAERLNLFTLIHETAHQLSFNTGLFDRAHAPSDCISEGLATYVELWQPARRGTIGGINRPRMRALKAAEDWIPIADLIADDRFFEGDNQQLAYGESWLLTHYFLRTGTRVPRWRDYISALRSGAKSPAETAEKHLGSLDRLNRTLKLEASKYLQGSPQ